MIRMTFQEIQDYADRGEFRHLLDQALEREAAVQRRIKSKQGIRMTAKAREVVMSGVQYMVAALIPQYLDKPFDPVMALELRFYSDLYALGQLILIQRGVQ